MLVRVEDEAVAKKTVENETVENEAVENEAVAKNTVAKKTVEKEAVASKKRRREEDEEKCPANERKRPRSRSAEPILTESTELPFAGVIDIQQRIVDPVLGLLKGLERQNRELDDKLQRKLTRANSEPSPSKRPEDGLSVDDEITPPFFDGF